MTVPSEVRQYATEVRSNGDTVRLRLATYGRQYDLGAFTETLRAGVFAKSITEAARALPLHVNHAHDSIPIGKAVEWAGDAETLEASFRFDSRAEAREMARLVGEGYMTGVSVGFAPIADSWDRSGEKPHVERREARLLEVSLVSVPAYDDAQVIAVRSAGHPEVRGLEVVPTPRLAEAREWLESLRRI
jgi:HK97 family phage prohead protease